MNQAVVTTRHREGPPRARTPAHVGKVTTVEELLTLRTAVAKLVVENAIYAPIFERLETEIATMQASDPVAKARAILASQKAMA